MSGDASIKVVVRARPMNARETREGARRCVEYYESSSQIVINGAATFAYDKVFPDTVDQETIFEQAALPLLDRVFGGFNATILAYGQTGSGKTYTMGTEDNVDTDHLRRGIIPRLVNSLFERINSTPSPESFTVTVSMFEVYGDFVYDLLRPDKIKLSVHGDEKKCVIVNLTSVPVNDLKGALKQLATGCHYRTKAETAMNAMSSRSHAVFTIFVEKTANDDDESSFSSKLQLVDLAGSERLKKTEAEGDRMKEGININSGLLNLSQVISALATKQKYVPYRASVITRVLQDSLGGNSFTIFLACISPADTNAQETLNTLRYADRAKQIKNKPIVNSNPNAMEISALRDQIARLKKENEELRSGGVCPNENKMENFERTVEINSLQDEIIRKDEEIREKSVKLSQIIVKLNAHQNRMLKLESEKTRLTSTLIDIKSLLNDEKTMEPAEILKVVERMVYDEKDQSTLIEEDGDDSQLTINEEEAAYDTDRLPQLQDEIDVVEDQIRIKGDNLASTKKTNDEIDVEISKRDDEKIKLNIRLGELEAEIAKLRAETKKVTNVTKVSEERRQRLKELERQHAQDKKALNEFKKLQETRKRMEESQKKIEDELKNLKLQRVRLLKEQRAEANRFKAYQQKHEREMQQMKTKHQKRELEIARQKRIDEQKLAVLQQRLSEAVRANKALKDLNMRRANRKEAPKNLQAIIEEDLEMEAESYRCENVCKELRKERVIYQKEIDNIERMSYKPELEDNGRYIIFSSQEEFEEYRRKKLDVIYGRVDKINAELKDLLKNSTLVENARSQSEIKWEKINSDIRPIVQFVYNQALKHLKNAIDIEQRLDKQRNTYSQKEEQWYKKETEMKRKIEQANLKFFSFESILKAEKSLTTEQIKSTLALIRSGQVIDEETLNHLESIKKKFNDVEAKVSKERRRTAVGALTPKPVLQRNERSRKQVNPYGSVVSSSDISMVISEHKKKRSKINVKDTTDDFVRNRVPMSPIRLNERTLASDDDDERMDVENYAGGYNMNSRSQSPINNGTFVIAKSTSPMEEEVCIRPLGPKSRRTGLGPL